MIKARIISIILLIAGSAVEAREKPWGFERDPGSCMMATYSELKSDKTKTVGVIIFYNYDPDDTRMAPEGVVPLKQYVFLWSWKGQLDEDAPAVLQGPDIDNLELTMSPRTWLERMQIFLLDETAAESFVKGMHAGGQYEIAVQSGSGPDSARVLTDDFPSTYNRYMQCRTRHSEQKT